MLNQVGFIDRSEGVTTNADNVDFHHKCSAVYRPAGPTHGPTANLGRCEVSLKPPLSVKATENAPPTGNASNPPSRRPEPSPSGGAPCRPLSEVCSFVLRLPGAKREEQASGTDGAASGDPLHIDTQLHYTPATMRAPLIDELRGQWRKAF